MAKCKYNDDFPLLAEGYARDGLSDKEIAQKLGISEHTFYQYLKRFPQFSQALKRGKAPVDTMVENALLKKAMGFEHDGKFYPPDATAQIFWLKNRKRAEWTDARNVQLTGKDGGPVQTQKLDLSNLSPEELEQLLSISNKLHGDKE